MISTEQNVLCAVLPDVCVIMNSKHWNLTDAVEINETMLIINTMLVRLVKNKLESAI